MLGFESSCILSTYQFRVPKHFKKNNNNHFVQWLYLLTLRWAIVAFGLNYSIDLFEFEFEGFGITSLVRVQYMQKAYSK